MTPILQKMLKVFARCMETSMTLMLYGVVHHFKDIKYVLNSSCCHSNFSMSSGDETGVSFIIAIPKKYIYIDIFENHWETDLVISVIMQLVHVIQSYIQERLSADAFLRFVPCLYIAYYFKCAVVTV